MEVVVGRAVRGFVAMDVECAVHSFVVEVVGFVAVNVECAMRSFDHIGKHK